MKGIILCGGLGKEMAPLSDLTPKASLLVQGIPVVQHVINGLEAANIKDIILVVGENGEPIIKYLRKINSQINFAVITQTKLGIEGAILAAKNEITEKNFFLAYGDIIAPTRFYKQLMQTCEPSADGGVAVTLKSSISDFGVILLNESGFITEVIEHPGLDKTDIGNYIGAGAYILPRNFFNELEKNQGFDAAINSLIRKGAKLLASIYSEEDHWMDLGNPFDLLAANKILFLDYTETKISTHAKISPDAHIEGPVVIEAGAHIDHGAVIKGPCYIGRNVYIGTNCLIRDHTAVEEGCVIGFSVEITRSHLQPFTRIGRLSFIGDSIIGKGVSIRSGVTIVNELAKDTVLDVRGMIFEKIGVIIGDSADIGENTVLEPLTVIETSERTPPGVVISDRKHNRLRTRLKARSF